MKLSSITVDFVNLLALLPNKYFDILALSVLDTVSKCGLELY